MKTNTYRLLLFAAAALCSATAFAQDKIVHVLPEGYEKNKIIPDKVFEIGLPLLILFVIANTIASVFRTKADARLKEKAIEKGISEQTLITLFGDEQKLQKMVYLKWFLVLAALGVALIYIQLAAQFAGIGSGYMALGVITLCMSIAFLIYYRMIRNK